MLIKQQKEERNNSVNNTEKISYLPSSNTLVIRVGSPIPLPPLETNSILLRLKKKFGYLLRYTKLLFSSNIHQDNVDKKAIDINFIIQYLKLALANSFLWKNFANFIFFFDKTNFLQECFFQSNGDDETAGTLKIYLSSPDLSPWKKPVRELKEVLATLGLFLKLSLYSQTIIVNNNNVPFFQKNKEFLLHKFQNLRMYELGVHTRFSCLDGVSSPENYINNAIKKDYAAIAVTDHYNIQSFPKFFSNKNEKLKIIYGCELEMLDDQTPPFFLNYQKLDENKKIDEFIYCIFDLETTGLFSEYNEIIEIGYVIYYKEKIIEENNYLIRPEKPFSREMLRNWYHKTLTPDELLKANKLEKILEQIANQWKGCILVAHNAIDFDYSFLNKAWIKKFRQPLYLPILDTIIVSKLVFPGKKTYSLEKLSKQANKKKVAQTHRALDDSKLLASLFSKITRILKEKGFNYWKEVIEIAKKSESSYLSRGKKIKVLVQTQEGLYNLYRLITISHTQRLSKNPQILRSDLIKNRSGLLIGASGGRNGEIFNLFSSFSSLEKKKEACRFYDYIEINSPKSFSYLYENGYLTEKDLNNLCQRIIYLSEELEIKAIPSHNVHYSEKKEKILKDIIIANKGMNGKHHYLYWEATLDEKEDRFAFMPQQHLLTKEEMIEQWSFLSNTISAKNLLFCWPKEIVETIEEINIKPKNLSYNFKDLEEKKKKLEDFFTQKANSLFGLNWPDFVQTRIEEEWKIIQEKYVFIFWVAWRIACKTEKDHSLMGSRGSVGCSFIAFLCNITELNPLPFYKRCSNCFYTELYQNEQSNYSCYDYQEKEQCPNCPHSFLLMEGLNMPMETFFGISGEKTPDIDLNFSSEYQKIIHDFVRNLLGSQSVHRIGTINTLKGSTSEEFWKKHLQLRKTLNSKEHLTNILNETPNWQREYRSLTPRFNEEEWYQEWVEEDKKTINNGDNHSNSNNNFYLRKKEMKEKIISNIQGIKRTTGQHPGGLLITPPEIDINRITPLNYPADRKTNFTTTHFEYDFLSTILLKIDILGHDEPTVLQKLFTLTKKDPLTISFNDEKVMSIFTSADTLGVTEFGTDFVRKILLFLKPTKFSHLVQICGFSHGTNVWQDNQQTIYNKGKLKLDQLIACRDDIWDLFQKRGLDKHISFIATEFIRKGKWDQLSKEIKQKIIENLKKSEKGEIYLSVLEKIEYIFPKPHSIAYTMTAWRGAYYKVYYPQQFYSTLLTYHIRTYDIWLMTLNPDVIYFRLKTLLETTEIYKTSIKEITSIIKVLKKLNTAKNAILGLDQVLLKFYQQLEELNQNSEKKIKIKENGFELLTYKERNLLFSLRIILEMDQKQLKYRRGVDLNNSEEANFKVENEVILFPLLSIAGFGKAAVETLTFYRKKNIILQNNWKESLSNLLNINHIKQLSDLEENNMLIW